MTDKEYQQKQEAITNKELIDMANKELQKLIDTGGKSFRMCIPVQVDDTDEVFGLLIKRFKELIKK